MGLTLALGRQAGIGIREVGGLELVAFADTRPFLDACSVASVIVLGIEGFEFYNDQVRPDMGAIADFSQITNSERSVSEARSFIDAVGRPEMLFDFTLSGEVIA